MTQARAEPRLRELESVIGYPALRRLVLRFGGGRVSPIYRPDSELALVLREAYPAFCSYFAGEVEWITIPLALDREQRGQRLREAVLRDAKQLTVDEIAPRYAISSRQVRRILADHRKKHNAAAGTPG